MRQISLAEAQAHFEQIVDDAEHGETIVITRHGKAIARLVPDEDRRRQDALAAMAEIEAFRKTMPSLTLEEITSAKHEGHRY